LLQSARRTPLQAEPGARHCYSDLGFLVLLQVLEAASGRSFEALFRERVVKPSGVTDFRWGWPGAAATESCPVRQILVEGTVHDLNCASLGGVSSHAGLFGTARSVAALAEQLMFAAAAPANHPDLPGHAISTLWNLEGPGSHRGGWDSRSDVYTSTGRFFPPDTVGHLGYTGTSVWIAPSRRTVVAFLTNRVHPIDDKEPIRAIRPQIHDAVALALGWG
jgi:CubicO group peptidase (beta-lactamase class C family)